MYIVTTIVFISVLLGGTFLFFYYVDMPNMWERTIQIVPLSAYFAYRARVKLRKAKQK